MKAVIYARYSSHSQRDQSIEDQIFDCKKYAKDKGYKIVEIYADHARTGRTDNRAEFQRMLKDSESRLFDVVLVWKLDRFGRNREETALNKLKLKKNGIKLESVMENIPDSPEGVLLESVIEGINEYYSRNLSENVSRGMESNARKCLVNGPLPLGYKNENKKIVIDEENAVIVRKCFVLYSNGYNLREISNYLYEQGYTGKRGNKISANCVSKILHNKRYIGTYIFGHLEIEEAFEPIIDKNLFYSVQDKLEAKGFTKHNSKQIYYFSNILYCGVCGGYYISEAGTSKTGKQYYYYKCKNRKNKVKPCSNCIIRKEEFEECIFEIIFDKILNNSIIDELAEKIVKYFQSNKDTVTPALLKRKTELEMKINNLVKSLESGVISNTIVKKINNYEKEIDTLNGKIEREKIKNPIPTCEQVKRVLKNFKLSYMNDQDLIRLVNNFVDKIIYNNGLVTIVLNYCFMGDDGKIYKGQECSNYHQMVGKSLSELNSVIYDNTGYLAYSFDYSQRKLAI